MLVLVRPTARRRGRRVRRVVGRSILHHGLLVVVSLLQGGRAASLAASQGGVVAELVEGGGEGLNGEPGSVPVLDPAGRLVGSRDAATRQVLSNMENILLKMRVSV